MFICPTCKKETNLNNLADQFETHYVCEHCNKDITHFVESWKENDMLTKMYSKQYTLQKRLGILEKINNSKTSKQNYINQMLLACHEELTEIMRETNYKNPDFVEFGWKRTQIENPKQFKEEIIDLVHFVLNLCIASGMNADEIFSQYSNKNDINHKRQDDKY